MAGLSSKLAEIHSTGYGWKQGLDLTRNVYSAVLNYSAGLLRYTTDFFIPYLIATRYFQEVEFSRAPGRPPVGNLIDYLGLLEQNMELARRGFQGAVESITYYVELELSGLPEALYKCFWGMDARDIGAIAKRQSELMALAVHTYPQAIRNIESEYGFHFEQGEHPLVEETDRFKLYQVMPSKAGTTVHNGAKPVLIIPPYVLGANILGFLPGEERSYAHCFANQGIPTYIRILKDIQQTEALQIMTGEDDARDTAHFCDTLRRRHNKPVTLNGYCQGGYNALCNLLSGRLDGLVDAFITCVSPMDGTRSKGLADFLKRLPPVFNDLAYGTKTLANGHRVADGTLMGWVYKLKSIESESPLAVFFRDLMMLSLQKSEAAVISKTAAALNYWLTYERTDLPLEITRISHAAYNTPIDADGTLPVKLFGSKLNLKRIQEKHIPWLICYGTGDDLVEKETALAPLDWVAAEVTPFPKGHVAIATSWSHPLSACALHTRFGDDRRRGPVRFHLDLDVALDEGLSQETPTV